MADLIATERSNIVAIADSVRSKTGNSGDMTISQIVAGINGIEVGGGNTDIEDALVTRIFSTYINDRVKSIGNYAFYSCSNLTTVSFPVCTSIGAGAFRDCSKLTTVSFPVCTSIGSWAFMSCYNLTSFYLTGSSLCKLSNSNVFISTPIGGYSASAGTYGSIYVPASLLTQYQTETNWTYFSSRFVGI